MNRNKLLLAILLSIGFCANVKAEVSSEAYGNAPRYYDQQVFISAYNNYTGTIPRDNVVVNDVSTGSTTAGTTLGTYFNYTQTSDSIFVLGVTDESIDPGRMGRVCVRGPHKAVSLSTVPAAQRSTWNATGTIISASSSSGQYGYYATADGTAGGRLGYILNATATSDTGDASGTYWIWVNPNVHK